MREKGTWDTVSKLLRLTPDPWSVLFAVAGTLCTSGLLIYRGHLIRLIIDSAVSRDMSAFSSNAVLIFGVQLASSTLQYGRTVVIGRYSERGVRALRTAIYERIGRLRLTELEKRHSGDLLSRMSNDLERVKDFQNQRLTDIIYTPVTAILAFAYLASVDWVLTLIMSLVVPVLLLAGNIFSRPMGRLGAEYQHSLSRSTSIAQDAIFGVEVLKAFGLEDAQTNRFRSAIKVAVSKARLLERSRALLEWVSASTATIPFLVLFGYSGYSVIAGRMTAGAIMAFVDLFSYLTMPVSGLPSLIGQVKVDMSSADRLFEVLSLPIEREEGIEGPRTSCGDYCIRTTRLSFTFGSKSAPVLSDVSLEIRNGMKVAIVGPSGSGKSTLLKLLVGFYEDFSGDILVMGQSIRDWDLSELRSHVALVPQDTYLFPGTVYDNISLWDPNLDAACVREAARMASADSFVSSLPDGYNTQLGEIGSRLSGGQKQRLTIARAVARSAPILMMDEPASSLDADSEERVWRALDTWGRGRTRIVVAHRLATVRNADLILVLDGGHLCEQGTHEQLLRVGGVYSRLYAAQTEAVGEADS